jgi:hypothetical protein
VETLVIVVAAHLKRCGAGLTIARENDPALGPWHGQKRRPRTTK